MQLCLEHIVPCLNVADNGKKTRDFFHYLPISASPKASQPPFAFLGFLQMFSLELVHILVTNNL